MSPLGPAGANTAATALLAAPGGVDDGRLEALRRLPEARAREAAAAELQTVFLTQLLAAMRRTIPENDFLPRSPARSIYEGMFDEKVARAVAAGDPLGLVRAMRQGGPARDSSFPAEVSITAVETQDEAQR